MSSPAALNELVRFLLARVDDDEAGLRKLVRSRSRGLATTGPDEPISCDRFRAELAAKRQLIGSLQQLLVLRDQPAEKTVRDAAAHMLHSLALPYADHAAYRKHWREVTAAAS